MSSSDSTTTASSPNGGSQQQRRVGRVERWLRKGYGFIIDMGRLETDDTRYGWVKDDLSGEKAFVYHNALKSDTENVFHRLFANEYVEFTIDLDRPRRDNRLQAFDVTGINGSELLCDLNAAAAASESEDGSATPVSRSRRSTGGGGGGGGGGNTPNFVPGGAPPPGATVQYIYYVPTPGSGAPPTGQQATGQVPQGFPPTAQSASAEPSYVMPASGIPVPK
jgi:hypothetical protein